MATFWLPIFGLRWRTSSCLSICLPLCLSVCLWLCPFACLSVCQSVCLSVCSSVFLSVCLIAACCQRLSTLSSLLRLSFVPGIVGQTQAWPSRASDERVLLVVTVGGIAIIVARGRFMFEITCICFVAPATDCQHPLSVIYL